MVGLQKNWKLVPEGRDRDEDLPARGIFQATKKKKNGDAGLTANCECDWYKIFQRWDEQIQIIRTGGWPVLHIGRFKSCSFPQGTILISGSRDDLSRSNGIRDELRLVLWES